MKTKRSEIRIEKIEQKTIEPDYEAGSGSISIPMIGDALPGLFNKEMTSKEKYYFVINSRKYAVSKEIFDKFIDVDQINVLYSIKDQSVIDIGV